MTDILHITDRERAKDALILQMSQGRDKLAARLDKVLSDRLDLKRNNEALAARVEALEAAVMMAYGYLWCVNNEPGTPNQYPPERAAHEARKHLRHLLTSEQRGQGITSVLPIVRSALKENQT